MAVVPMAAFTALPCQLAIRWFLVLQPIIAGLGLYAFLRSEGMSRAGAATGGFVASLLLSASLLLLNPAISAPLAWTAVLQAAASRLMHARTWPSRLIWIVLTALAWGQLAASHLSEGLVIGSVIVVPFIASAAVREVRAGRLGRADLAILMAVLVVALPLVNLAYLLPRLIYLPRTSLHLGYARLEAISRSLGSNPGTSGPAETGTVDPTFPLRLGAAPGLYAGVAALLLSFAGWWSRRLRSIAVAFSVAGGLCYLASLGIVAHAVR